MFLTVYLSNNDQHFTEVPITPDTVCRDVVELCKEPGEMECHLAEMWRGSGTAWTHHTSSYSHRYTAKRFHICLNNVRPNYLNISLIIYYDMPQAI